MQTPAGIPTGTGAGTMVMGRVPGGNGAGTGEGWGPVPAGAVLFFSILIVLSIIPAASAGEVVLSTPQSEYSVLTGEEALIPLTIASTYDHDITGTLRQVMVPVSTFMNGTSAATARIRTFSAFTEERTVTIPAGISYVPADYRLTFTFSYSERGGRIATLSGIVVHVVTAMDEAGATGAPLTGTDTADPAATSTPGSSATQQPGPAGTAAARPISEATQDMSALKGQLSEESNQSAAAEDLLRSYILTDPLTQSINRSLTGAGFTLEKTDVTPVSNTTGSFQLTYLQGKQEAQVSGYLHKTRVLFAEESSGSPIPLPSALLENASFSEYGSRVAGKGFLRDESRINFTTDWITVEIGYANAQGRILHLDALITGGTVTAISGESPDDPFSFIIPLISLIIILLISAGIWYLARHRPEDRPVITETAPVREPPPDFRRIAGSLLDEAERDAAAGTWPEAYRKTGRAIRVFLSHDAGSGDELTVAEVERLAGLQPARQETVRPLLERCRTVGFAKGRPDPAELREIVRYARALLDDENPAK